MASAAGAADGGMGEFPILCETCLGDNPFLRMTKEAFGGSCKVCETPMDKFRWKPGHRARFKSTQICRTCARVKNVCQCCILDLQYGLPVQVRDRMLNRAKGAAAQLSDRPHSDATRLFLAQKHQRMLANGEEVFDASATNAQLQRMARMRPNYNRNLPNRCSFFAKGECKRGDRCPFLHELPPAPKDDPMSQQNIKDRFYGTNDPVAEAMLGRQAASASNAPPPPTADARTLWVGGLPAGFESGAAELRAAFGGTAEAAEIRIVARSAMAFVEFPDQAAARAALAEAHGGRGTLRGAPLQVSWAKPRPAAADGERPARRGGAARGEGGAAGGHQGRKRARDAGGGAAARPRAPKRAAAGGLGPQHGRERAPAPASAPVSAPSAAARPAAPALPGLALGEELPPPPAALLAVLAAKKGKAAAPAGEGAAPPGAGQAAQAAGAEG